MSVCFNIYHVLFGFSSFLKKKKRKKKLIQIIVFSFCFVNSFWVLYLYVFLSYMLTIL